MTPAGRAGRALARGALAAGLAAAVAGDVRADAAPPIGQGQTHVQGFVGKMTDEEWGDIFRDPAGIKWRDARQIGVGIQREWPVWTLGFVGVEAQAMRHFGEQTHWEVTAPVFIRTPRTDRTWIPALAYGLGLSYATEPPRSEIARTGESTELLAHWFFEVEFGGRGSGWRPYLRLHHRSHAWQTFDARTGSNAIFLGIRTTPGRLLGGR